ncbi:MAG TPA: quinoprotein relay system zinc metallohydrolase 2 [Burkholderiaceae bacterium]|nr:quinoprotein relay system zinc metallohydrolase 2 [Burkholderiaceae bacterium]
MLLRRIVALLLSATLHALAAAQPGAEPPTPLSATEVAPGVHVHSGALEDWAPENGGDVANLGFVVGSRCVAVIDTGGTPQLGARWRAAIEQATRLPVCFVFDTHAHPDHVLGNAAFAGPDTRFVASAKFNAAMAAREPYYLRALERDFGIRVAHEAVVYPTLAVDGTREFDLGDRVLVAQSWPTSHTDNDLTVYDRNTRTLFASDLLFVQHIPVVDGKLRGWLRSMPQLERIDAALVVPGHGPTRSAGPDAWKPQQEYLEALLRETRAAIKSGKTLSQAVDSVAVEAASRWQLAERFHRRNVTAAFAELEWED